VREEERRVDQQQQARWRPTTRQLLWAGGIAALAFLIIVVCGYLFGWKWTGLVKDANYHKRTLWDWLQLLIIPAVLAGVGLWFNRQQREQELKTTSQQREQELKTADRRAQDEALQAYLDQIGQLLLDKDPSLRQAEPGDEVRTLARARTLTVLARLHGERKGTVVQFLYESGLIAKDHPVLALGGADLTGAHLSYGQLDKVGLSGADLSRADLTGADLSHADLSWANISKASLPFADLSYADLSDAHLRNTDLSQTYLRGANLSSVNARLVQTTAARPTGANSHEPTGTDLSGAQLDEATLSWAVLTGADLSGADLSEAVLSDAEVTEEQLATRQNLEGATMPDGQRLKGFYNPDGLTFEEWLKSRGKGSGS
jgi:uncharacterized protein YjbI with pentapeptide repeats